MTGKHPQSYLIAGFTLVVLLMLGLAALSAQRLEILKGGVDQILQEHVAKIELTHRLRSIARERMIRMNLMTIASDPFLRNQSYMEFIELGNQFISTRKRLEGLVKDSKEQVMLAHLRGLNIKATPVLERIVELVRNGNLELARSLLFGQSLQLQQQILDYSDTILAAFEQSSQAAMERARQTYHMTYILMMSMTALAVLLTALIGIVVMRLIKADREQLMSEIAERRRTEYELRRTEEGLEQTVSERTAKLRENAERLWHLAHHDMLTGLPNRSQLYASLSQSLSRARRSGNKVALMLCDLDRFKAINDNFGHDAGDMVLVEAARRIKSCVRESDMVARLAGDEFTVTMEELKDQDDTLQVARKIIAALSEPFDLPDERSGMIGISIGIALHPDDAQTMDELLKYADVAMYKAKEQGRGGYCLYAGQD